MNKKEILTESPKHRTLEIHFQTKRDIRIRKTLRVF